VPVVLVEPVEVFQVQLQQPAVPVVLEQPVAQVLLEVLLQTTLQQV
jgi:hypothetical protein